MTPKIPREDLLADLRRVGVAIGSPPKIREYADRGAYSKTTYKNRFGSWLAAIEAAGWDPDKREILPLATPDGDLVDDLQRVADALGRPPTRREYTARGSHSYRPYYRAFGSWTGALGAAGLGEDIEEGGDERTACPFCDALQVTPRTRATGDDARWYCKDCCTPVHAPDHRERGENNGVINSGHARALLNASPDVVPDTRGGPKGGAD